MKDDFYGKKQPFRSPMWLVGAAVLLIAAAVALLWPSESLAPAQEEQLQSAAADQAARLEDGAELFQRLSYTRCEHVVTRRVTAPVELYGKTLGIVGLGRVGALVAQRLNAFGNLLTWTLPSISVGTELYRLPVKDGSVSLSGQACLLLWCSEEERKSTSASVQI